MGQFDGQVMLVTGGARGMGRATAIALAREGATVVVSDVLEDKGHETVQLISAAGGRARFVRTDIGSEAEVDRLFALIETEHRRLDGAFNAAAVALAPFEFPDTPVEVWDKAFHINTRGTFLCLRHELRIMRAQRSGAVVVVASGAGLMGVKVASAYAASKHAVIGMVKSAALDLAPYQVRVNCLCPGTTRTEMIQQWFDSNPGAEATMSAEIPMGRLATPEDMADAAVWLLSDAARYVTGQPILADGGLLLGTRN